MKNKKYFFVICCFLLTQVDKLLNTPRTCFGPICWPSSGCNVTYRAALQDVWGVFLGGGIGGGVGELDLIISIVGSMT